LPPDVLLTSGLFLGLQRKATLPSRLRVLRLPLLAADAPNPDPNPDPELSGSSSCTGFGKYYIFDVSNQGDQTGFRKNSLKCPNHFFVKINTKSIHNKGTSSPIILGFFCNFLTSSQRKQTPIGRKFAQYGHPFSNIFFVFSTGLDQKNNPRIFRRGQVA
jgi:hypothetical protein